MFAPILNLAVDREVLGMASNVGLSLEKLGMSHLKA
jgi:hypothetical protein